MMEAQDQGISGEDDLLVNNDQNLNSESQETNLKIETRKKYNKFVELLLFLGFQTTSATKQTATMDAILTIIEGLQIVSLIISPTSNILLRGGFSKILRNILTYTTAEVLSRLPGFASNQVAISLSFGIQVLVFLFLPLYMLRITSQKDFDSSKIYNHKTTKYLAVYFRVFRPCLLVPILNLNLNVLACTPRIDYITSTPGLSCWQGIHLAFAFISIVSILLLGSSMVFLMLLYKDLNPLNKDLVNGYLQLPSYIKIVVKVIVIIIYNWSNSSIGPVTLPFVLVYLTMSLTMNPRTLESIVWGMVTWTAACSTIQQYVVDSSEMYYLLCIPIIWLFMYLISNKMDTLILEIQPTKEHLAIRQLLKVVHLMESHTSVNNLTLLQNFILAKKRQFPGIYKQYSYRFVAKMLGVLEVSEIPDQDEYNKRQKICYMFVHKLSKQLREMHPKSADLLVIHSHISKDRLKNNYQSYYLMRSIERQHTGSIYYISECRFIRNQIEANLLKDEAQITEENGLNLAKIATFHKILSRLKENLLKASVVLEGFWGELQAPKPLSAHLVASSDEAVKLNFSADKLYQVLLAMSPSNVKLLRLYGNYISKVKGDPQVARGLLLAAISQAKNLKKSRVGISTYLGIRGFG